MAVLVLRTESNATSEPVRGRDVKLCPPDRLPGEGETIFSKVTTRSISDYCIDPDTGCWVWQKSTLRNYPISGNVKPTHRYWERANGRKLPAGWHVHHLCKNTRCLNPEHLEAREFRDHLSEHWLAHNNYTLDDMRHIKSWGEIPGIKYDTAAALTGLHRNAIQRLWTGETWPELGGKPAAPPRECLQCGIDISTHKRNKVYCTPECRVAYNSAKPRRAA